MEREREGNIPYISIASECLEENLRNFYLKVAKHCLDVHIPQDYIIGVIVIFTEGRRHNRVCLTQAEIHSYSLYI